jgi:hypothetical protein
VIRRLIPLFLLLASAPAQSPVSEAIFYDRVLKFGLQWDVFVRKLIGCPVDDVIIDPEKQCHPKLGELDRNAFRQARKAATELFQIRECGPE